jgi:predicted RNase H-like HicB family nuclease
MMQSCASAAKLRGGGNSAARSSVRLSARILLEGEMPRRVPNAAGTLRRYLEYVSTVLANNLRAPVEYHGNGQYDLGDLMPPIVRAWKGWIKTAKEAAASWGQDTTGIEDFEREAKGRVATSLAEQWMINKAVHTQTGTSRTFRRLPAATRGGRTFEDAVAYAEEALAVYLETLADNGDPIPEEHSDKPVSLGITVRTPVIA